MPIRNSSNVIDVQKLVSGAVKLELKLLGAGVEALQVYTNQASRLSSLASDTLKDIESDKANLADTARKLTEFGRQSVTVYAELAQRLGVAYYNELEQLAGGALKPTTSANVVAAVVTTNPAKPARATKRKSAST